MAFSIAILFHNAYAEQQVVNSFNFGWSVKTFIDDFHEAITINPIQKAKLQADHASDAQKEIEKLSNEGKPIPQEIIERVDEKIKQSEETMIEVQTNPENNLLKDLTQDLISGIKQASEANQIREAISEYHQLKADLESGRIDSDTAKARGLALEQKANSLEIVRQHCYGQSPINAMSLATESDGYAKLQERCPELKKYDLSEIMSRLDSLR